jgi:hypothetical protein
MIGFQHGRSQIMKNLFETTTINHLVLRNRFVRSATWEDMAEDQRAPPPRPDRALDGGPARTQRLPIGKRLFRAGIGR